VGLPLDYSDPFVGNLTPRIGCVEILGMFGNNEIVLFAMYEEGRDESLLYMLANGVQILDVKVMLSDPRSTLSLMVDLTKLRAMPLNMESPPPYR